MHLLVILVRILTRTCKKGSLKKNKTDIGNIKINTQRTFHRLTVLKATSTAHDSVNSVSGALLGMCVVCVPCERVAACTGEGSLDFDCSI